MQKDQNRTRYKMDVREGADKDSVDKGFRIWGILRKESLEKTRIPWIRDSVYGESLERRFRKNGIL